MKIVLTVMFLNLSLLPAVSPTMAAHSDIFLTQRDGTLVTGRSADDSDHGGAPQVGIRYHVSDIAGLVPFVDDDPGVSAPAAGDRFFLDDTYQPLPDNTRVGFNIRAFRIENGPAANLFFWDGSAEVDFQPVTNSYDWLNVRLGSLGTAVATGAPVDVEGFDFTATDPLGLIHSHLVFDFDADSDPTTPTSTGVFLAAFEFNMSLDGTDGRATSRPHYVAWFNGPPGPLKSNAMAATNAFLADEFPTLRLLGDVSPLATDSLPDDLVNAADIDALLAAVRAASTDPLFDLNSDSMVDAADVATLLDILDTQYGDANLDGIVDGADLAIWQTNYGTSAGWTEGNFNGDARVDGRDLMVWQRHVGFSAGPSSAVNVVPEPSSLVLGILFIALGFSRKVAHARCRFS